METKYFIEQLTFTTLSKDDINKNLISGKMVLKLGIQGYPGLKFKLNNNADVNPIIIGETGIFEIDLMHSDGGYLNYLSFTEAVDEQLPNIIIIDILGINNTNTRSEEGV